MIDDNALVIYTDGSSYSSPRRGGTGIRFVSIDDSGEEVIEDLPIIFGYQGATNNQMELQSPIIALGEVLKRDLSKFSRIIIRTDSSYIVSNYKNAIFQWPRLKWLNRDGKPILNAKQWQELSKLINKIYQHSHKQVEFEWVKGHSKDSHNKAVDKLAKNSAKQKSDKRISIVKVRRKKFQENKVEIGSVQMEGQRISVYIVTDEYFPVQKINYYRYQVISKSSSYYKKTDFAYSKELLSAGHSYYVMLNKDNKNPRITKKFRELPKT